MIRTVGVNCGSFLVGGGGDRDYVGCGAGSGYHYYHNRNLEMPDYYYLTR